MVKTNMMSNINRILRVVVDDGRELKGRLLVYDQHMNVVMADVTETRPVTRKMKEENASPTRTLGLILLRGEHVVSVTVLKEDGEGASAKQESNTNYEKAPKSKRAVAKRNREDE